MSKNQTLMSNQHVLSHHTTLNLPAWIQAGAALASLLSVGWLAVLNYQLARKAEKRQWRTETRESIRQAISLLKKLGQWQANLELICEELDAFYLKDIDTIQIMFEIDGFPKIDTEVLDDFLKTIGAIRDLKRKANPSKQVGEHVGAEFYDEANRVLDRTKAVTAALTVAIADLIKSLHSN